jgi:SHS2 domain-containing protein
LENIAIADIAFEAEAKNLGELFKECFLALQESMVELKTLSEKIEKKIELKSNEIEKLLYDFLSELVFLKDAEQLLFKRVELKIEKKSEWFLLAKCFGEKINPKKHVLRNDVKAITLHEFEVKKIGKKWKAKIVLDV